MGVPGHINWKMRGKKLSRVDWTHSLLQRQTSSVHLYYMQTSLRECWLPFHIWSSTDRYKSKATIYCILIDKYSGGHQVVCNRKIEILYCLSCNTQLHKSSSPKSSSIISHQVWFLVAWQSWAAQTLRIAKFKRDMKGYT